MGIFGGGHKGNTTTWGADDGNRYVKDELTKYIRQYASSLGLSLDQAQIDSVYRQLLPNDPFTGQQIDGDRARVIQETRDFILPVLYNLKTNPTVGETQLTAAANTIKTVLGRDATQDEINYFAKELSQGKSNYELQQELMSLPEYQRIQASKDRETLSGELLQQQQAAFEKALPSIVGQYQRSGVLNSSGLNSALALAQKDLEQQRQGYLAQVGQGDVSQIRANAYNAFQNYNAPFQQTYNPANIFNTQFGLAGSNLSRQREIDDYNRQRNDYLNALQNSQRNNGFAGALQGAFGGAQAGGNFGPYGAAYGAGIGGLLGYFGTRRS